ncbi:hypothetical protein Vadar_025366 [Vaccinium darrowii]|uniref:Uncharacterized protein n=1 Tax=Vaccinium darrowii TaxID=229202 RepID=A0ACB7YH93_9ERIC|nr:hypothetical protein Vadar_025366 [Vaccinium darrowii]
MDVEWLRQIFSSFGQVVDVFIPIKRSSSFNTKFGFIRFKEKEEAFRAVDALDGLLIRNFRIFVQLAKYSKPTPNAARSYQKVQGRKMGSFDSKWKPIISEDHCKQRALDPPSFADIVRGVSNGIKTKLVEAKEADMVWLGKSAVGQLINYCYVNTLQDLFISNDYFDCINEVVYVKINGVSYPVKVVEDPLAETSWEKRVFTSIEIKKGHVIDGKEVLVEIDPKDDNSFDFDAHEAQDKGISEESRIDLLDGVVLPTVDESDDNSFCSVDPTSVKVEDDGRDDELGGGLESFIGILIYPIWETKLSFRTLIFNPNDKRITYQGDATAAGGLIQVTKNLQNTPSKGSVGRATYSSPIHLWDNKTGNLTDFNTHFSFIIQPINTSSNYAPSDGLAFFLSPYNATIPVGSGGGYLALFDSSTALNYTENQIVAVEFDTYQNSWDPSTNHVGIDVNLIKSETYLSSNTSLANNETANAWVNYNSTTQTLSVYLTYEDNPVFQGNYNLSYVVNLTEVLPEWISVGFSAAAGEGTEIHNIVSWTFNSTLGGSSNSTPGSPPPSSTPTGNKTNLRLMVGLAVGIGVLICGVGLFWFMKWKQIVLRGKNDVDVDDSTDDDDDYEEGKASKESDVYSFGVVALEIACGRKPMEVNRDLGQVSIIEWVWSLYGKGQIFEVVDKDLTMKYDEHQIERLMLVGLCCCHPDHNLRPSIRQVINILTFEAPLPILPSQMPVPIYLSPPMCMPSYSSSVLTTDSNKDKNQCSSSSKGQSCYSSFSIESPKALLQNHEG